MCSSVRQQSNLSDKKKPDFISVPHLLAINGAIDFVLCVLDFRAKLGDPSRCVFRSACRLGLQRLLYVATILGWDIELPSAKLCSGFADLSLRHYA